MAEIRTWLALSLAIQSIRRDGGTQSRGELDQRHIERLLEARQMGHDLPPVKVIFDGADYWLYDGFHRVRAAELSGWETIKAEVRQGSLRDAVLLSCGANYDHGLPRSIEDKCRAVRRMLDDEQWQKWSDREIARQCNVSHTFVSKMRKNGGNGASKPVPAAQPVVIAQGTPQLSVAEAAQFEIEAEPAATSQITIDDDGWELVDALTQLLQEFAIGLVNQDTEVANQLYDSLMFVGADKFVEVGQLWASAANLAKNEDAI